MSTDEKLHILETQEQELVFEKFSNHDALELGKEIADRLIDSKRPVAIIIRLEDQTVFTYTMKGKEESHFGWANRKANLVEKTGHSSMCVRIAYMEKNKYGDLVKQDDIYAIGCGGFPITVKDAGRVGVIGLSGLVDPEDHTIIVEILSRHLGKQIDVLDADAI